MATAKQIPRIQTVEINNEAMPPLRPESMGLLIKNSKLKCVSPFFNKSNIIRKGMHAMKIASNQINIFIKRST